MKVAVSEDVSVNIETDVTVTIEDISEALWERMGDIQKLVECDQPFGCAVRWLISECHDVMTAITDEMVGEMSIKNRAIVREKIQEQADRYR